MPEPVAFVDGVISIGETGCITFAPDGRTAYFAKHTPRPSRIMVSRFQNGHWSAPEPAGFSGRYPDWDPLVSPDGRRLFFASLRPVGGEEKKASDLWYVERAGDGWSEARNLGEPVNTKRGGASFASAASDGTLYFFAARPDSRGGADIYRSKLVNGRYQEPENLGEEINSSAQEVDPYIAPDQSFLIFASDRPGGMGKMDLYVSFRREGRWTSPRNLGLKVNSSGSEVCPCVSPDGRYFFFTSGRESKPGVFQTGIYQVDLDALKQQ